MQAPKARERNVYHHVSINTLKLYKLPWNPHSLNDTRAVAMTIALGTIQPQQCTTAMANMSLNKTYALSILTKYATLVIP